MRVCPPLLLGFNTLYMQRLTTLPSNHILLSGRRRQQQQVVRPIGVLWSGKIEKRGRELGFAFKTNPGPHFKVALWSRVTGALQSPLIGPHLKLSSRNKASRVSQLLRIRKKKSSLCSQRSGSRFPCWCQTASTVLPWPS